MTPRRANLSPRRPSGGLRAQRAQRSVGSGGGGGDGPHRTCALGGAVLIAPASADFLARLAGGQADDLLATLCLATAAPIAVAPAMNHLMWANAATQANVALLMQRGIHSWVRARGTRRVARSVPGACSSRWILPSGCIRLFAGRGPLAGRRVLITAGPTRERIDPVRFISNRSSGKMGFAVAQAAREAGADVVLVAGPVSLATPAGVRRMDVESRPTCSPPCCGSCPARISLSPPLRSPTTARARAPQQKIKKTSDTLDLAWSAPRTCWPRSRARADRPFVVGFAAETEAVEQNARTKLHEEEPRHDRGQRGRSRQGLRLRG